MLTFLKIRDLAIIDELEVEFEEGFNVITGETGAGKSIIINSLGILISPRVPQDIVRKDAEKAEIFAQFIKGDEEILLKRIFFPSGRTRCFLGDEPLSLGRLESIGESLINIYSQNEYQSLLNKDKYIDLLDDILGLREKRASLRDNYLRLRELEERIKEIEEDLRGRDREIPYLEYQMEEIDRANLKEDEEEELKERLKTLKEASRLTSTLNELLDILYLGRDSFEGKLKRLLTNVRAFCASKEVRSIAEKVESLLLEIEDLVIYARGLLRDIEFHEEEVAKIEERLSKIYLLKEKYGRTLRDILEYRDKAQRRLEYLLSLSGEAQRMEKERESLRKETQILAEEISRERKEGSKVLEKKVMEELASLSMRGIDFRIQVLRKERMDEKGIDDVDFLISTNPGEPLKPLRRIASGGELSRIMLAIKKVMGEKEPKTLIFDEIDTGIGGRVAEIVGRRLKEISKTHQIICITHLPQIAALGDHHFLVEKRIESGKAKVGIRKLKGSERVVEIARMLSGEAITDKSVKKAEEMLSYG